MKRTLRLATLLSLFNLMGAFTLGALSAKAVADEPSLDPVLDGYHTLEDSLGLSDFASAHDLAAQLIPEINHWLDSSVPSDPGYRWMQQCEDAAMQMSGPSDEILRPQFSRLSQGLIENLKLDSAEQSNWQLWHCRAVSNATIRYAYWLQPLGEAAINPYQGPGHESCAESVPWNAAPH